MIYFRPIHSKKDFRIQWGVHGVIVQFVSASIPKTTIAFTQQNSMFTVRYLEIWKNWVGSGRSTVRSQEMYWASNATVSPKE